MMDLIELHSIFAIAIFLSMLAGLMIPVLVLKPSSLPDKAQLRTLSCCNCIAGGVFIGMCFLGLIPYVQESFADIMKKMSPRYEFPLAEFVIVIGFFLVLIVEQVCHKYLAPHNRRNLIQDEADLAVRSAIDGDELELYSAGDNHGNHQHGENGTTLNDHSHLTLLNQHTGFKLLMLLLAISIHSLFEGLALGLQTDSRKATHLFIGIIMHECLVALAVGINLAYRRKRTRVSLLYAVGLSATIPLGIVLGIFIRHISGLIGSIISGVLQGFAAGIFIYIAFVEMLPTELANDNHNILKVMFYFIGFLIVAVVNLVQQVQ